MVYALTINEGSFAPAKLSSIGQLMNVVLPLMMTAAAIMFLAMLLLGAFRVLRGGDNPESLKKGYATIVWSAIGLGIVVASFVVVKLLGSLLGIQNILPQ
jgi:hypothetical protein